MKVKLAIILIFYLFTFSAYGEKRDSFPWLMTPHKHAHLTKEQEKIYLYAYFETVGFILYGHTSQSDPEQIKQTNTWIDCVNDTKNSEKWTPQYGWGLADHLDKSAAYVLYNVVSPLVCEGYFEKADSKVRVLQLFSYPEWDKWSLKDKSVYISGYLDTVVSFQMRLKEAGMQNDLRDIQILVEATGIDGVLSEVIKIKFEKQNPLPWSVSLGVGSARKNVQSK